MFLIVIFKVIIIIPFIIDLLLRMTKISDKQRAFIVSPLYLTTMWFLIKQIMMEIILYTFIMYITIILITLLLTYIIVKKKYKKVYLNYLIRTFLNTYYKLFIIIYITLVIIGAANKVFS